MARSLGPVELGELDGLGSVSDGASGYRYRFVRSPERPEHVLAETHDAIPQHAFGSTVVLGIGSGELDRSYAVRHGATLAFAPLEVLALEGGRRATLAPGHMMRSGVRLETPITNACLDCHTDSLPAQRFPLDLEPPPDWRPRGISCGACHGKAEAHADWQASDEVRGDPILRQALLSRERQLAICARCHLQGDARVELVPPGLPRDQLPGDRILREVAVYVAADSGPEVGFVSQVERLLRSACFLKSELTCSTCHDPHRSLHQEPARLEVRQACLGCHASEEHAQSGVRAPRAEFVVAPGCARQGLEPAAGADCVSCHMPKVGTFDVAAVQIHDHHIRRDIRDAPGPSQPETLRILETREGRLERFRWPWEAHGPEDPGLLMLAYASAHLQAAALALLDQPSSPPTERLPDYQHLRGLLLEHSGRVPEAEAAYRQALQLDPNAVPSATNLALILAGSGRPREAYDLLTEQLNHYPQAEGALRNRALIAMQLGKPRLFAADLEKAFAVRPSATLAQSLSRYYGSSGDALSSSRWLQLAQDLDPTLGP